MNKRLIITFIALAAVVLLVVLSCVIFIVGDVQVETTAGLTLTDEQQAAIVSDSKIAKFSSIFSISEEKATANIESKHPALKVVVIERKAPNKVVINMTYRTGIIAVATDGGYAVLDRDLKCIEIASDIDGKFYSLTDGLDVAGVQPGDFVDNEKIVAMIRGAEEVSFVGARFAAFFVKLSVSGSYVELTTNTGVIFRLNASDNIGTLVKQCYNYYLNYTDSSQKQAGYIYLSQEGFTHSYTI